MNGTEQVDGITYDLSKEYYVVHHDAGISEYEGPMTELEAYRWAEDSLTAHTILRFHDEVRKLER